MSQVQAERNLKEVEKRVQKLRIQIPNKEAYKRTDKTNLHRNYRGFPRQLRLLRLLRLLPGLRLCHSKMAMLVLHVLKLLQMRVKVD